MAAIYYRFKTIKGDYTINFDGMGMPLAELKRQIVQQGKMSAGADFDLKIVNAQTNEGTKAWLNGKRVYMARRLYFSTRLENELSFWTFFFVALRTRSARFVHPWPHFPCSSLARSGYPLLASFAVFFLARTLVWSRVHG